jgi:hypothetical protein
MSMPRALIMIISTSAILTAIVASGCRTRHLGDDTGRAYQRALADQRAADGPAPIFGADVAAGTLAARRRPTDVAVVPATTLAVPTLAAPIAAPAPIALEAR